MRFIEPENGPFVDVADTSDILRSISFKYTTDLGADLAAFFKLPPKIRDRTLTKVCIFDDTETGRVTIAIALHHIIADGTSCSILKRDFEALFNAQDVPPVIGFSEYSRSERAWFGEVRQSALLDYWRNWAAKTPISLAPVRRNKLVWRQGRMVIWRTELDRNLTRKLEMVAKSNGTTMLLALIALYSMAISQWSGETAFAIRSVMDGRTTAPILNTVGLILRHYPISIRIPRKGDFPQILSEIVPEYLKSLSLELPTHWPVTGADFRSLHEKIGYVINYFVEPACRNTVELDSVAARRFPREFQRYEQHASWSTLPPVYLRIFHSDRMRLFLEFNHSVVTHEEQVSLLEQVGSIVEELVF